MELVKGQGRVIAGARHCGVQQTKPHKDTNYKRNAANVFYMIWASLCYIFARVL
jgi:hypothetical protein